ncbi:MAG: hypothetical protein JWP84_1202 [Tardiphaga sp.]|nr:hypothetical protein [Tardiphaga sp.]
MSIANHRGIAKSLADVVSKPCKFCGAEPTSGVCCPEDHDEKIEAKFRAQVRFLIATVIIAAIGTLPLVNS